MDQMLLTQYRLNRETPTSPTLWHSLPFPSDGLCTYCQQIMVRMLANQLFQFPAKVTINNIFIKFISQQNLISSLASPKDGYIFFFKLGRPLASLHTGLVLLRLWLPTATQVATMIVQEVA